MLNKLKNKSKLFFGKLFSCDSTALESDPGEGYVDTMVKVIIAIVIGGLLLTFFTSMFQDTVFPTVTQKITDMFS